eukprot:TRINITY_DN5343_c0_g1_i1.p1 TRINITY_DN5343_c0_g1~~TRINITY_DN5343_c0_g1_i1.p1  ORF type:complete len:116 (-),score=16.85 TRINITY_DN5343_c0_g1_i1:354-701(-)
MKVASSVNQSPSFHFVREGGQPPQNTSFFFEVEPGVSCSYCHRKLGSSNKKIEKWEKAETSNRTTRMESSHRLSSPINALCRSLLRGTGREVSQGQGSFCVIHERRKTKEKKKQR